MVMEAPETDPTPTAAHRPLDRVTCTGWRIAKSTDTPVRCGQVLFVGFLQDATIEIRCPRCGRTTSIDRRPS